jgi:hypothetical protein
MCNETGVFMVTSTDNLFPHENRYRANEANERCKERPTRCRDGSGSRSWPEFFLVLLAPGELLSSHRVVLSGMHPPCSRCAMANCELSLEIDIDLDGA